VIVVTGFGPFGSVTENPSEVLARASGVDFRIVPVTFRAADEAAQALKAQGPEAVLAMGVHGRAAKMRLELFGRNVIGPTADVDGVLRGGKLIWPRGPSSLGMTLLEPEDVLGFPRAIGEGRLVLSASAGNYLCNYFYYQLLRALPGARVGFLHVPRFERMAQETQLAVVQKVIDRVARS